MRRCLIGQYIRRDAAANELGQDVRGVPLERDRTRGAIAAPRLDPGQGLVKIRGRFVEIVRRQPARDAVRIHFDDESGRPVHRRRQRLRAAHPAQPRGQDPFVGELASIVLAPRLGESFVGALHDALAADVDPRAGGHLAVHRQAAIFEIPEDVPGRPGRHQEGVGNEHARCAAVGAEHANGLPRLNQQRLVRLERAKRVDDRVERLPVARGLSRSAVDDQIFGTLGNVGIQIVHQHAQRGFLRPALARKCRATGRPYYAGACCHTENGKSV